MNYYLIIKKDNKLRHFIILHLNKLINSVKNIIEIQLLTRMNKFSFTNENDNEITVLKQNLAEKENELLEVNPEKLAVDNTEEILNSDDLANIRADILNDLKKNNPELERENWI